MQILFFCLTNCLKRSTNNLQVKRDSSNVHLSFRDENGSECKVCFLPTAVCSDIQKLHSLLSETVDNYNQNIQSSIELDFTENEQGLRVAVLAAVQLGTLPSSITTASADAEQVQKPNETTIESLQHKLSELTKLVGTLTSVEIVCGFTVKRQKVYSTSQLLIRDFDICTAPLKCDVLNLEFEPDYTGSEKRLVLTPALNTIQEEEEE